MYKVTNITSAMIPLSLPKKGTLKQFNLMPQQSIEVEKISDQIYRLADPSQQTVKITKMEV